MMCPRLPMLRLCCVSNLVLASFRPRNSMAHIPHFFTAFIFSLLQTSPSKEHLGVLASTDPPNLLLPNSLRCHVGRRCQSLTLQSSSLHPALSAPNKFILMTVHVFDSHLEAIATFSTHNVLVSCAPHQTSQRFSVSIPGACT